MYRNLSCGVFFHYLPNRQFGDKMLVKLIAFLLEGHKLNTVYLNLTKTYNIL